MLEQEAAEITEEYDLGKVLGRGQFGTTRIAVSKATRQKFACKSISKRKMVHPDDIEDVKREIQVRPELFLWTFSLASFDVRFGTLDNLHWTCAHWNLGFARLGHGVAGSMVQMVWGCIWHCCFAFPFVNESLLVSAGFADTSL